MQFESLPFDSQLPDCQVYETEHARSNTILGLWQWITLFWSIINSDMSDICLISADISDICRYLSDIGHIWNLGSFTKAVLLQKCSISLICPDIAIRSRSSRSDWLHRTSNIRWTDARTWKIWGLLHKKPLRGNKRMDVCLDFRSDAVAKLLRERVTVQMNLSIKVLFRSFICSVLLSYGYANAYQPEFFSRAPIRYIAFWV